jgi:hypothetical protein
VTDAKILEGDRRIFKREGRGRKSGVTRSLGSRGLLHWCGQQLGLSQLPPLAQPAARATAASSTDTARSSDRRDRQEVGLPPSSGNRVEPERRPRGNTMEDSWESER